jgi:preprotein translocase subunit SecF
MDLQNNYMYIIKYSKIFLGLSALVIITSLVLVAVFGLKKGIDFTGGAQVQVTYTTAPTAEQLSESIAAAGLGSASIAPITSGYSIKLRDIGESQRPLLKQALSLGGTTEYTETSFTSVGPSIGSELTKKSIIAILAVVLAIISFIAFSFRGVSEPVPSWKYGLIAITTLAHDIIIPLGLFAILGHYVGAEVDKLFVVALLTILGVSISDTIVVFDRIRENLKLKISSDFAHVVGTSLSQSFARSINTSLTVVIVLFALFFFGPEPTKNFALVLITGMIVGTYSSIFVASPLLVLAEKWQREHKTK